MSEDKSCRLEQKGSVYKCHYSYTEPYIEREFKDLQIRIYASIATG